MSTVYLLEWSFTPPNFFEERTEFTSPHGTFVVEGGKAEIRVPEDQYERAQRVREELHRSLDARFLATQMLAHVPYTLSQSKLTVLRADGRKDFHLMAEPGRLTLTGQRADFKHIGSAGNTIRDTRKERIDYQRALAQKVAAHITNPVVKATMQSYAEAVSHPGTEFVHLYEVREAMAKHFGGETKAVAALGIAKKQWSRLGRLANDEPVIQGRHRGAQLGALREATPEELEEARAIARAMIENYCATL